MALRAMCKYCTLLTLDEGGPKRKGDLPYLSSNYIVTTSQTRINNEVI